MPPFFADADPAEQESDIQEEPIKPIEQIEDPGYRILRRPSSLDELLAMDPPEPLIENVVNAQSLIMLSGPAGCGKTFIALSWACALTSQLAVHDTFPYKIKHHGYVLYVAAEGSPRKVGERIAAWCDSHSQDRDAIQAKMWVLADDPQLSVDTDIAQLSAYIEEMDQPPLMIIFDTKAMSTLGFKENDADEQGKAIRTCKGLMRRHNCSVMMIHHSSRSKESDSPRGSSAWDGGVDLDLRVVRDLEDVNVVVMTCHKRKDEESGCQHRYELKPFDDTLVAFAIDQDEETHQSNQSKGSANELHALELLESQDDGTGVSKSQWIASLKEAKVPRNTAYAVVARLIKEDRVQEASIMKGNKWVPTGRYQVFSR